MSKERKIKFTTPDGKFAIVRFVKEGDEWVCHASDEFVTDLGNMFEVCENTISKTIFDGRQQIKEQ